MDNQNNLQQEKLNENEIDNENERIYCDFFMHWEDLKTMQNFSKTSKGIIYSKYCLLKYSWNILSQKIVICPKVILRADLGLIKIGEFSVLCEGVLIKPSQNQQFQYSSCQIGKYCIIGQNTIIKAAFIGNCVWIGKNCIIDDECIIEDNVHILDNTVIMSGMKLSKNTQYQGQPVRFQESISNYEQELHTIQAVEMYEAFNEQLEKQDKRTD